MSYMECSSIQFQSKVDELESQLRSYELEQARLKEDNNNAEIDNSQQQTRHNWRVFPSSHLYEASDEMRNRNSALLSKLHEMEMNSALFAARAEKLRLMKSEYEQLMQTHYNTKRNENETLNNLTTSSIGVNTEISGPIISCHKNPTANDFEKNSTQKNETRVIKSISFLPDLSSTSESDTKWRHRRRFEETNEIGTESSLSIQHKTPMDEFADDTSLSTTTVTTTNNAKNNLINTKPNESIEFNEEKLRNPTGSKHEGNEKISDQQQYKSPTSDRSSGRSSPSSVILDTSNKIDPGVTEDESEATFDPDKDLEEQSVNHDGSNTTIGTDGVPLSSTFQRKGFPDNNNTKDINEMGDFLHNEEGDNNNGGTMESAQMAVQSFVVKKNDETKMKKDFNPAALFGLEEEEVRKSDLETHEEDKSKQKIGTDVTNKGAFNSSQTQKPFRLKLNYDEDSEDSDLSAKNKVSENPSNSMSKKKGDEFDDFFDM